MQRHQRQEFIRFLNAIERFDSELTSNDRDRSGAVLGLPRIVSQAMEIIMSTRRTTKTSNSGKQRERELDMALDEAIEESFPATGRAGLWPFRSRGHTAQPNLRQRARCEPAHWQKKSIQPTGTDLHQRPEIQLARR